MASPPIHWITARAYVHATEEEDRVREALDRILPGAPEEREVLEGQFGNPLVVLSRRVSTATAITAVWDVWTLAGVVDRIREDVEDRLDSDGVLHLRLDKQAAFRGSLALAKGPDTVDLQVKLKAYPAKEIVLRQVAREIVGAP